jgi:hypothetical protein
VAYVSAAAFATYVGAEGGQNADELAAALAAAEQAVNDHCGRTFDPPAGSATRRYAARPYAATLTIHDLSALTAATVTDDGTSVSLSDLQFEPVDGRTRSGAVRPYTHVRRLSGSWSTTSGEATISITSAYWGWTTVPAQVVEATKILGKDLVHLRQNRFGVAGFGEFGVVRVRDNPHVSMLLASLRRDQPRLLVA